MSTQTKMTFLLVFCMKFMVSGVPYDNPQREESAVTLRLAGSLGDFDCPLPENIKLGTENGTLAQHMRKAITSREPVEISIQADGTLAYWSRALRSRGYKDSCKEADVASCHSRGTGYPINGT